MDIGARTVPLSDEDLGDVLAFLGEVGITGVEFSCGGYAGTPFVDALEASVDPDRRRSLRSEVDERGVTISALGCHNNPLHPVTEVCERADRELRAAIALADAMSVDTVSCFSGLPGGGPDDRTPNWITAPWPPDHAEAFAYQWEVARRYWSELNAFADDHGVDLAIEMHVNMLVHDPTAVLRLRESAGDRVRATFDPSHLYWQGIDAVEAARYLGERDALAHVHVKDVQRFDWNHRLKGALDPSDFADRERRSWTFAKPGVGHGEAHWRSLIDTLRTYYDGTLVIEHFRADPDGPRASIRKAAAFLRRVV